MAADPGSESDDFRPFTSIPFCVKSGRDTRFGEVLWCKRRGMGKVSPLPAPDEIAENYNLPEYYTHGTSHIPEVSPTLADKVLGKLAYLADKGITQHEFCAGLVRGRKAEVLDIGAGGGALLQKLAAAGASVTGIEPDPAARAQSEAAGLKIFPGTAEDMPDGVPEAAFDFVVMSHVLEHTRDPGKALANARAMLREGG
ncbi:MAG: class I SAM-dependent methyltransferase, partial [Pseudomonadota bacterium]